MENKRIGFEKKRMVRSFKIQININFMSLFGLWMFYYSDPYFPC